MVVKVLDNQEIRQIKISHINKKIQEQKLLLGVLEEERDALIQGTLNVISDCIGFVKVLSVSTNGFILDKVLSVNRSNEFFEVITERIIMRRSSVYYINDYAYMSSNLEDIKQKLNAFSKDAQTANFYETIKGFSLSINNLKEEAIEEFKKFQYFNRDVAAIEK